MSDPSPSAYVSEVPYEAAAVTQFLVIGIGASQKLHGVGRSPELGTSDAVN